MEQWTIVLHQGCWDFGWGNREKKLVAFPRYPDSSNQQTVWATIPEKLQDAGPKWTPCVETGPQSSVLPKPALRVNRRPILLLVRQPALWKAYLRSINAASRLFWSSPNCLYQPENRHCRWATSLNLAALGDSAARTAVIHDIVIIAFFNVLSIENSTKKQFNLQFWSSTASKWRSSQPEKGRSYLHIFQLELYQARTFLWFHDSPQLLSSIVRADHGSAWAISYVTRS